MKLHQNFLKYGNLVCVKLKKECEGRSKNNKTILAKRQMIVVGGGGDGGGFRGGSKIP